MVTCSPFSSVCRHDLLQQLWGWISTLESTAHTEVAVQMQPTAAAERRIIAIKGHKDIRVTLTTVANTGGELLGARIKACMTHIRLLHCSFDDPLFQRSFSFSFFNAAELFLLEGFGALTSENTKDARKA